MHSSRMRTVHNSSHLLEGVPGPRGVPGRGVYMVPGGCTWSGGIPGPRGVYLVPGDVPGPGGPGPEGVPGSRGYLVPGGVLGPKGYLPRYPPHEQNDRRV